MRGVKDYQHFILWLDYFSSSLTRREGRMVPYSQATRNPTIAELEDACTRAGYAPEKVEAFFPKRPYSRSGYVSVERKKRRGETLREVALMLTRVRGESKDP